MPKPMRTAEQAEIDTQTVRYRSLGYSYGRIAEEMGISKSTAYARVQRALAEIPREAVEEYRTIQREQLDGLMSVWLPQAIAGDVKAAEFVLRLIDRRSKIEGTDQPVKHEVITLDAIDAEIRRLEASLAELETEPS
ncbi:MAG: sigma factor-like helix-turn-helix DNA-binding protein [Actinomycetota bacterium]|jgi:hypothetical protein